MAKKIRLDFSKTEERSGFNTRHIAEGLHKMRIDSCLETEANDGVSMLVYSLVPADPALKSRKFPYYCKLQQNQLWKLRDLLVAAGQSVPKRAMNIDPSIVVGKFIAAEVEDDTYQGTVRSQVNGTYGLDILDEDGDSSQSEDEDDESEEEPEEEYEEDGEEEEDDSDEDEEEEDVDYTTFSLAELRARAKELEVNTVGLKKAELIDAISDAEGDAGEDEEDEEEDEDELEDEELEDEDFEEEEEEEEEEEVKPAAKRRVVAKTASKAAPAAPAKRTIMRRR